MSTHSRLESPLARASVALTMLALAVVASPHLLLGFQREPIDTFVIFVSQMIGLAIAGIILVALTWTNSLTPRATTQKIVSTYLGTASGIVVSSAQFLAYMMLAVVGASLASHGISSLVGLSSYRAYFTVLVLLVAAIPALIGREVPWRVHVVLVAVAMVVVLIVLGAGLVGEASTMPAHSGRGGAHTHSWHVLLQSIASAMFPGAVMFLTAERPMKDAVYRRTSSRRLIHVMIPVFSLILLTVYFILSFGMEGQWEKVPILVFSEEFLGGWAKYPASLALLVLGWASAALGFWCLPRLLRELAIGHILPRSFASSDARRPRQLIVVLTLVLGSILAASTRSRDTGGVLFVLIVTVIFVFFSLGMAFRGHTILRESMSKKERVRARASLWGFLGYTLFGVACIVAISIARPRLSLITLAMLAVPVAFLVFFRRGRVRVVERLAATDLSHGRTLPTRVHGVVLVNALDRPALRALTFARATRLTTLTAVTVDFDAEATRTLRQAWKEAAIPVNLTVLGTPQGASTANVVDYVRSLRSLRPADIVMVFVPRVISTGMGQRFFIRHSTPRIISALRMERGVVISEVPFALEVGEEKDE